MKEDLSHLFLDCPLVRGLWDAVFTVFSHNIKLDGSLLELWQEAMTVSFSIQLKALWQASIITVFWVEWFPQNQATFEGANLFLQRLFPWFGVLFVRQILFSLA